MKRNRKAIAIIISILIISSLSAYLVLGSGGIATAPPHAIAIAKVAIDQADSPIGFVTYAILADVSNSGRETWNVSSTSFKVVSTTSAVYSEVEPLSGTYRTAIPVGQHQLIELFFPLPTNERPAKLSFDDQTARTKIEVAVPVASGWLSKFEDISDVTKTGSGNYVGGIIANAVVLNTSYPYYGQGDHVSYTFFTGDRVTVGIELQYYKQPADPASIMVTSVRNTDGFTVVSMVSSVTSPGGLVTPVKPALPLTMTGWGSRAEIEVTFLVPNQSYSGAVHFVVGFNSSAA